MEYTKGTNQSDLFGVNNTLSFVTVMNYSTNRKLIIQYFSLGEDNIPAKILSYNRANRAVAILCNHQRAPPKTFEKSMQNLQTKVGLWAKPEMEVGLVFLSFVLSLTDLSKHSPNNMIWKLFPNYSQYLHLLDSAILG